MDNIEKLGQLLDNFSNSYSTGILRVLKEKLQVTIDTEDIETALNLQFEESELVSHVNGETYYLKKYRYIRSYSEIEDRVGRYDDLPDYQCKLVATDHSQYILEVISKKLLADRGFYSFSDWKAYINRLNTLGVIDLDQCIELTPSSRVVVIYRIPTGYDLLDNAMPNNVEIFAEAHNTFNFLSKLNSICEQTIRVSRSENRSFSFVTIHSHFILVNQNLEPKLCAIGASLPARTVYVSSHRHGKATKSYGMGFSAYSFFVGLLLFEILTDQCPVKTLDDPSLSEGNYLSDNKELDAYTQHVRAFLRRATHYKPDWRYPSFGRVGQDLEHISTYLAYRASHKFSSNEEQIIQFVDFMLLRFGAYEINPELSELPLEKCASWLINSIAEDFSLYFSHSDDFSNLYQSVSFNHNSIKKILSNEKISPYTENLIKYFNFWIFLKQVWDKRPDPVISSKVTLIGVAFLLSVIEYELKAFGQVLSRKHISEIPANHALIPAKLNSARYLSAIRPRRYDEIKYANETIALVNSFMTNMNTRTHVSQDLPRFDAISLFMLFAYRSLEIVDHNQSIIFSNIESDNKVSSIEKPLTLAQLSFDYHQRLLELFLKEKSSSTSNFRYENLSLDEWLRFSEELLSILWDILPGRRVSGKILRYQKRIHLDDQGKVFFRNYIIFPVTQSFTEIDLINRNDIDRSVTDMSAKVDIVANSENHIANILVKPIMGFPQLPANSNNMPNISNRVATIYHWTNKLSLKTKISSVFGVVITLLGLYFGYLQIKPIAQIENAVPSTGFAPLEVQFTNVSTNSEQYSWNFGDIGESDNFSPSFEFQEPGVYEVTLTAYRNALWIIDLTSEDSVIIEVYGEQSDTGLDSNQEPEETEAIDATAEVTEFFEVTEEFDMTAEATDSVDKLQLSPAPEADD